MEGNQQTFGPLDSVDLNAKGNPKRHGRMIVVTLLVILVGVFGFTISKNKSLQEKILKLNPMSFQKPSTMTIRENETMVTKSEIADRAQPWLEVVSDKGSTEAEVDKPIVLMVKGFSARKDIAGYDLLLKIDRGIFKVDSITSVIDGFKIVSFDREDHFTVTGFKDLQLKTPVIFDNTNILKIELTPLKKGVGTVSVVGQSGKENTQFVDIDVNSLKPQIGSVSVNVK